MMPIKIKIIRIPGRSWCLETNTEESLPSLLKRHRINFDLSIDSVTDLHGEVVLDVENRWNEPLLLDKRSGRENMGIWISCAN